MTAPHSPDVIDFDGIHPAVRRDYRIPHYPTADELAVMRDDLRQRNHPDDRLCEQCGLPDDPWPHPYPGTVLATERFYGVPLGTPVRRRPAVVILLESRDQAAT